MEYHSPYKIEITPSDIPSFIFSSGTAKSRQTPQYFDAETPTRCYSLNDAEILVKRVAKGLQSLGLRPSEKVLLFSGNRLHFPVLLWGTIAAECVFTGCTPSASVQGKSSTLFQSRVVVLTKFSQNQFTSFGTLGLACFSLDLKLPRRLWKLPRLSASQSQEFSAFVIFMRKQPRLNREV